MNMARPFLLALLLVFVSAVLGDNSEEFSNTACQGCMTATRRAQEFLSDTKNEEEVINYAKTYACDPIPPHLKPKCESMVDEYGTQIFTTLQEIITPEKLCIDTGLCKTFASVNLWTSDCKCDDTYANGGCMLCSNNNNCAVCKHFVEELKMQLHDPQFQKKLVDLLTSDCEKLHKHVAECKLLVLEYAPLALANVDAVLDDDTCSKIGMCQDSKIANA